MEKRLILLVLLLGWVTQIFGQSPLTILFEEELTHLMSPPARFINFTFKYNNDTIYYSGQPYHINPPEGFDPLNSAFGFIQFTDNGWNAIPSQTIFFIDNYDSETPELYVDQNFDLDFNNEKAYDFSDSSNVIVELMHKHSNSTKVKVGLNHIVFKDKAQESQTESYASHEIPVAVNNEFLPALFWITETRYNYKLSVGSGFIGLKDFNNNGKFNDIDDQILIADSVGRKINDRNQIYRYDIGKDSIIGFQGQDYLILIVDSLGNYLTLELAKGEKTLSGHTLLKKGVSLPNFEFTLFSNEKTSWESIKPHDKFILIDFWGTWCKPCLTQIPKLKTLKRKYQEKLEILSLAYQDNHEKAIEYVSKNDLDWVHGFANDTIIDRFQVSNFPYYILVDNNGVIQLVNTNLDEIEEIIR